MQDVAIHSSIYSFFHGTYLTFLLTTVYLQIFMQLKFRETPSNTLKLNALFSIKYSEGEYILISAHSNFVCTNFHGPGFIREYR